MHYDPLARVVRQHIRSVLSRSERSSPPTPPSSDPSSADADANDDPSSAPSPASSSRECSIPVVYSSDVPSDDVTLLPLANSELAKGFVDELAPLRDFRVRILPVLGPLPALFGLHISTYVLCELAGSPIERPLPVRHRKKLYERMWKDLLHRESRIAGKQIKYAYLSLPFGARAPPANRVPFYSSLPLTTADIALLYDDFALGRSIVPPHTACVRPGLVRWDPRVPLSLENCVVGEMKEVSRAMSRVFAMPDEGAVYEEIVGHNRAQGYVDALESRSIQLGSTMVSLSGVPRRCGASRLLVSHSFVLRRRGDFASGHCSNMSHFWMSTKALSLGPPKCILLVHDPCGCIVLIHCNTL
jgi:hypothetical protein